jgi:hypothetical protein
LIGLLFLAVRHSLCLSRLSQIQKETTMKKFCKTSFAAIVAFGVLASSVWAINGPASAPQGLRSAFVTLPGNNPFFPKKAVVSREAPAPVAELTEKCFQLTGISLNQIRQVATINGRDFQPGEQATVVTTQGKHLIRCLEVTQRTVTIALTNGRHLQLPVPGVMPLKAMAPR